MQRVRRIGLSVLLSTCLSFVASAQTAAAPPASLPAPTAHAASPFSPVKGGAPSSIQRLQVLGGKDAVEIEIAATSQLVPQTRVLTGPDRLVVDFPNSTPSSQLRNQSVNRGEVKDLRVGLFQSNPPVTRVVLDLKSAQSYQIFPSNKSVIIKISGRAQINDAKKEVNGVDDFPPLPATRPGLLTTNYTAGAGNIRAAAAEPVLDVTYRNGMLSIKSSKSSLSEILYAVHQRTGADITLSAGAEQERVAAEIGPGPAPEVLARLLNGSKFNFLIVSSPTDTQVLDKVILSPKAEGAVTPLPPMATNNDMDDDNTPTPPPIPQRPPVQNVQPLADSGGAVPSPDAPPGAAPPTNMPAPHGMVVPPGQAPSTPPPDENSNPEN